MRVCILCGCDDDNCDECVTVTGSRCSWAASVELTFPGARNLAAEGDGLQTICELGVCSACVQLARDVRRFRLKRDSRKRVATKVVLSVRTPRGGA